MITLTNMALSYDRYANSHGMEEAEEEKKWENTQTEETEADVYAQSFIMLTRTKWREHKVMWIWQITKKDHGNEATMKQESHNSTCPEHTSQNMVSLVKRRKAWLKREAPINQERKKLNQDEKSDPHEVHHSLNLTS